jgi:hypothetical protein
MERIFLLTLKFKTMLGYIYSTMDYVVDGIHLFLLASLFFGGIVYLINDFKNFDKDGSI